LSSFAIIRIARRAVGFVGKLAHHGMTALHPHGVWFRFASRYVSVGETPIFSTLLIFC
jgi:hypothetical protein